MKPRNTPTMDKPSCLANPSSMLDQLRRSTEHAAARTAAGRQPRLAVSQGRMIRRARATEMEKPAETVLIVARVIQSWETPPDGMPIQAEPAPAPELVTAIVPAVAPAAVEASRRNGFRNASALSRQDMLRDIARIEYAPAATGLSSGRRALQEDFLRSLSRR